MFSNDGTYIRSFCKLIYMDDEPCFVSLPVVCIRYDDSNEIVVQLCAQSKQTLGLSIYKAEAIRDFRGASNMAEGGYWVQAGKFGGVGHARNRKQMERAWALAALIARAAFSRQYDPVRFSPEECNDEFDHIVRDIRRHHIPHPPDTAPPLPLAAIPPHDSPGSPSELDVGTLQNIAHPDIAHTDTATQPVRLQLYIGEQYLPPTDWQRVYSTEHDSPYYWNTHTNETSWTEPRDGIWIERI